MTPVWLNHALSHDGLREVKGPQHNMTIMCWVTELGAKVLGVEVLDDETPWCGIFAAHCIRHKMPAEPLPPIAIRAKSWVGFGVALGVPALGAVLVFGRSGGGGHVGFYLGEDAECYHVFGGNQGDSVCRTRIKKDRLLATRWPAGVALPTTGRVYLTAAGVAVSKNEA